MGWLPVLAIAAQHPRPSAPQAAPPWWEQLAARPISLPPAATALASSATPSQTSSVAPAIAVPVGWRQYPLPRVRCQLRASVVRRWPVPRELSVPPRDAAPGRAWPRLGLVVRLRESAFARGGKWPIRPRQFPPAAEGCQIAAAESPIVAAADPTANPPSALVAGRSATAAKIAPRRGYAPARCECVRVGRSLHTPALPETGRHVPRG